MTKKFQYRPFHSTQEELSCREPHKHDETIYQLAFTDTEFMLREELRPVRIQLELLKPELILQDHEVDETIVFFGSARIPYEAEATERLEAAQQELQANPADKAAQRQVEIAENVLANSRCLNETVKLAEMVSRYQEKDYYVVTGGGPSFMEAANRGAQQAGKPSVALGVILPHEQLPNPYVTPELTFQFHYFAIRKMHFLMRAKALVAFPGGFGTMDELFECLTLLQTQKIESIPLILFRREFWDRFCNFDALVLQGTISEKDLDLIHFVETAEEAWEIITDFYKAKA